MQELFPEDLERVFVAPAIWPLSVAIRSLQEKDQQDSKNPSNLFLL